MLDKKIYTTCESTGADQGLNLRLVDKFGSDNISWDHDHHEAQQDKELVILELLGPAAWVLSSRSKTGSNPPTGPEMAHKERVKREGGVGERDQAYFNFIKLIKY